MTHDFTAVYSQGGECRMLLINSYAAQQHNRVSRRIYPKKLKLQTPSNAISISTSPPPSIQQHRQPQSNPNDNLPPHNLPSPTLSSSLVNRDMPPAAFLSASSPALVVRRLSPTHALQLLCLVGRRRDRRVEDRRVGVVSFLSFLQGVSHACCVGESVR